MMEFIKGFFELLLDVFYLICITGFTWLLFLGLRDRFFRALTIMVCVISLFGSLWATAYITSMKAAKYADEKAKSINKSIEKVGDSIDKLNETVGGVKKKVDEVKENPVVKGGKKVTESLDKADKAIKDKGFEIRERITGKKAERLEE